MPTYLSSLRTILLCIKLHNCCLQPTQEGINSISAGTRRERHGLVRQQGDQPAREQSCKMSVMMNPISHQEDASKSREASAASCKADGIVFHPVGVLHHLQQAGKGIGGVHRRHRSGSREVHPVSRLAAGSRRGNVLETGEGERGGSEGPSGQRRACLSRAPCNPPTRKAPEASPERKSASGAVRQAAGRLEKNRQALGGGWRRPTWLLAGQARREAPGQKAGEVVGREKPR